MTNEQLAKIEKLASALESLKDEERYAYKMKQLATDNELPEREYQAALEEWSTWFSLNKGAEEFCDFVKGMMDREHAIRYRALRVSEPKK